MQAIERHPLLVGGCLLLPKTIQMSSILSVPTSRLAGKFRLPTQHEHEARG